MNFLCAHSICYLVSFLNLLLTEFFQFFPFDKQMKFPFCVLCSIWNLTRLLYTHFRHFSLSTSVYFCFLHSCSEIHCQLFAYVGTLKCRGAYKSIDGSEFQRLHQSKHFFLSPWQCSEVEGKIDCLKIAAAKLFPWKFWNITLRRDGRCV